MLVLELSFVAGRFHATPWGRNVNEGVAEWPPSPYRLLRALYDTWKRKRPEWPAERVEPVLAALAEVPPQFYLPPATASHTRSFLSTNSKDATERRLIFDAFVVVSTSTPVLVGWRGVTLDDAASRATLSELCACMNYLGRSESWVGVRFAGDVPVDWNCTPANGGATESMEMVRVACAVPRAVYAAKPYVPTRKKGTKASPLPWLEALAFSTADLIKSLRSDPPAFHHVLYQRPANCLEPQPVRTTRRRARTVDGVLYALESKVLPPVTSTLEVAERVRRKLMGIHARLAGSPALVSSRFSGKDANGRPLEGHRHVYILPQDRDGDGRLDHLLVVCKEPLDAREQLALDRLESLWQAKGRPDIRCVPLQWGTIDRLFPRAVTRVRSTTPFVPPRHYRRGRGNLGDWLAEEVKREAKHHGLPAPVQVTPLARLLNRGGRSVRWIEFRRNRKEAVPRMGYGLAVEFAEPVRGAIALGYGCHFGLGQFESSGD